MLRASKPVDSENSKRKSGAHEIEARIVTVFVSSPSDVLIERRRVASLLERLQTRFHERLTILPILFEERYYLAHEGFQEQIPDAGTADLVISIFWSKLGSELSPERFGTMSDGKPYPGGAVYELLRALAARSERNSPDILVYRKLSDAKLSVTDPQQRHQLSSQLDAFEAFWSQWFVSGAGHFLAGFHTFDRPDELERMLEQHLRSWLEEHVVLGKEVAWRIAEQGSPFRGLQAFESHHAPVFFGRDREIQLGRQRLLRAAAAGVAYLLVVGASGVGKSSLARAGLMSQLSKPGDIDGVDVLRVAVVRPNELRSPLLSLAEALFQQALPELRNGDYSEPDQLANLMQGDGCAALAPTLRALDRAAHDCRERGDHDRDPVVRLLLVVDQLEELFTARTSEAQRAAFVKFIDALARSGRGYVITTLRSASYEEMSQAPLLLTLKDEGSAIDLTVPRPELLADMIRKPATHAGLTFERRDGESLDDVLVAASGTNADAMPLLEFTLQWLFDNREGERLTFAAYEELGGLEGAIGRTAEAAFQRLDQDAQRALPALLRGLAELAPQTGGLVLRNMPAEEAAMSPDCERLVAELEAARVLLSQSWASRNVLRLAHDAVLRGWKRASDIAAREQEFYRIRADLIAGERRWRQQPRNDLLLPAGLPLSEAQSLLSSYRSELGPELVGFIDQSQRFATRLQRRGYGLAAVFGLSAIVACALGLLQCDARQLAENERMRADTERVRAESERASAESARRDAEEARNQAQKERQRAEAEKEQADKQRRIAEVLRERAEANLTQPCSEESRLRSQRSSTFTTIAFENRSQNTKVIWWLDWNGQRANDKGEHIAYAVLEPGQSYEQPTYLGHYWVITDLKGTCETIYLPSLVKQDIVIKH